MDGDWSVYLRDMSGVAEAEALVLVGDRRADGQEGGGVGIHSQLT